MTEVDPEDDSITRWVIHHYRYDRERRQRRHVLVRAYDDPEEFERALARLRRQVEGRRTSADADPAEHVTGDVWGPGHRARAATGHLVQRAIEHGADPSRIMESGRLPSHMVMLQFDDGGDCH